VVDAHPVERRSGREAKRPHALALHFVDPVGADIELDLGMSEFDGDFPAAFDDDCPQPAADVVVVAGRVDGDLVAVAVAACPAVSGHRPVGVVHEPAVKRPVEVRFRQLVDDVVERAIGEPENRGVAGADKRPDVLGVAGGRPPPRVSGWQIAAHDEQPAAIAAGRSTTFLQPASGYRDEFRLLAESYSA